MSFGDVAGAAVRYAREGFAVFEYMRRIPGRKNSWGIVKRPRVCPWCNTRCRHYWNWWRTGIYR